MDYYTLLGVPRTATPEEIKKAYRQRVKQHHPDKGGDAEKFKRINEAYEVLSNSDKRSAYDNPHEPGFSFRSHDFRQHNPFAGSPFEHMFGQNFSERTPRNKDIMLAANISLAEAITGKTVIMQYQLNSGRLETVTAEIPSGARAGDTIRFQGLGDDGNPRFPRGDLHVRIKISKTKNWERDGNNLITRKIINVFDLMLGCAIIIKTLDDKTVQLKIPKGTRHGQIFSVSGYGIPDLNTKQRGNLYVEIVADIPSIDNASLIEEIEKIKNKVYTKK